VVEYYVDDNRFFDLSHWPDNLLYAVSWLRLLNVGSFMSPGFELKIIVCLTKCCLERWVLIDVYVNSLEKLLDKYPNREMKKKLYEQKKKEPILKLQNYFDSLRDSNIPLPRIKIKPNKVKIASECNLGRDIFYDNTEASELLIAFDIEDCERNGINKKTDLDLLKDYINLKKSKNILLPQGFKQKPNLVKISEECIHPDLFNEAETLVDETELTETPAQETITYTRKKPGRKPLPKDLPRKIVRHELSEAEQTCDCGHTLHAVFESFK